MSSRFSSNSEAFASELLEILEKYFLFTCYVKWLCGSCHTKGLIWFWIYEGLLTLEGNDGTENMYSSVYHPDLPW